MRFKPHTHDTRMMRKVFIDMASGFGIAAAPKVGTLSIARFLFQVKHGREPAKGEGNHKWIVDAGMNLPARMALQAGLPVIAVHRDPYERIRSCYQHRVVREREASARSFRDFCERLAYYRSSPKIAWHTDPQSEWLGDGGNPYAASLGLEDLHLLPALLRHFVDRQFPEMPWAHRMIDKPPWEDGLRELLSPWVAADLNAGWTGKTSPAVLAIASAALPANSQSPKGFQA
jgi:hypothetical protein